MRAKKTDLPLCQNKQRGEAKAEAPASGRDRGRGSLFHSVLLPERFSGRAALHLRYSLLSFSRVTSASSLCPESGRLRVLLLRQADGHFSGSFPCRYAIARLILALCPLLVNTKFFPGGHFSSPSGLPFGHLWVICDQIDITFPPLRLYSGQDLWYTSFRMGGDGVLSPVAVCSCAALTACTAPSRHKLCT